MGYYLKAVDYGLIHIEYGSEVLAALTYNRWNPSKAKLIYDNAAYTFEKANLFGTKRTILKNGVPVGKIRSNWGAIVELDGEYVGSTHEIKLKPKGFFWNKFTVHIDNVHKLTLHRKSTWVKSSYSVEIIDNNIHILPMEELMGILSYTMEYFNKMGGG